MYCKLWQTSINEVDRNDEQSPYAIFPGFQQRDRQPLPVILPPADLNDVYQDADESQPLTSDSQQDTPQHMANQMMVTPAVSELILLYTSPYSWNSFYLLPFHP